MYAFLFVTDKTTIAILTVCLIVLIIVVIVGIVWYLRRRR